MSNTEENKALIRRLVAEVYGSDLDRLNDLVAENYVDHSRWGDRDGLRRMLTALRHAYPEIKFSIDDLIAEGDRVAACIHCDCAGEAGSAVGKKRIKATVVFRVDKGKVVEHWGHSDSFF